MGASSRVASGMPLRVRTVTAGVRVDVGVDVGVDLGADLGAEHFNRRAAFAAQCEVLSRRINQNFAHPACKC